jgi:serine/threonine protein kinase
MGVVYLARQPALARAVALKVLPTGLVRNEVLVSRFRCEIAILGKADHPNLVKIYTSGVEDDSYYYAMEPVAGVDGAALCERLKTRRGSGGALIEAGLRDAVAERSPSTVGVTEGLAWRTIARLFAGAADALAYLHGRGVIHRDVKPGNLMMTDDLSRLVVMDLGLAATLDASQDLTRSDGFVRSYRYAAPEQISGPRVEPSPAMDVFSLGRALEEILGGALADVAASGAETPSAETRASALPPSVPRDLKSIVARATEPRAADRYPGAAAMAEDLRAFARGEPPRGVRFRRAIKLSRQLRARPWLVFGVTALLVLGMGLAVRQLIPYEESYAWMSWRSGVPAGRVLLDERITRAGVPSSRCARAARRSRGCRFRWWSRSRVRAAPARPGGRPRRPRGASRTSGGACGATRGRARAPERLRPRCSKPTVA